MFCPGLCLRWLCLGSFIGDCQAFPGGWLTASCASAWPNRMSWLPSSFKEPDHRSPDILKRCAELVSSSSSCLSTSADKLFRVSRADPKVTVASRWHALGRFEDAGLHRFAPTGSY